MSLADLDQPALPLVLAATPRPRRHEPWILSEASLVVARSILVAIPSLASRDGWTVDAFAAILADARPSPHADGLELSRSLSRSLGDADQEMVDALDAWSCTCSDLHRQAVAAWVRDARLVDPVPVAARVVHSGHQGPAEGFVFHDAGLSEQGCSAFVPDASPARFVRDGLLTGHFVVEWETLAVTGPATAADLDLLRRTREARASSDLAQSIRRRDRALADAHARSVASASEALPPDGRSAAGVAAAATALALAAASPDFDPSGDAVVALEAACAASRADRRALLRAPTP